MITIFFTRFFLRTFVRFHTHFNNILCISTYRFQLFHKESLSLAKFYFVLYLTIVHTNSHLVVDTQVADENCVCIYENKLDNVVFLRYAFEKIYAITVCFWYDMEKLSPPFLRVGEQNTVKEILFFAEISNAYFSLFFLSYASKYRRKLITDESNNHSSEFFKF